MRYDGQYVNVKRMGLALDGLIRSEYPGDFLQFIEMYTFAKPRHVSEVAGADAEAGDDLRPGRAAQGGHERPEHQRGRRSRRTSRTSSTRCRLARQFLAAQDTPNRQIDPHHRRPADGPLRGQHALPALPARPADRGGDDARGACSAPAKGSRSTSSCCRAGTSREEDVRFAYRHGRERRRAACSSPPAATWTATWSGTTSSAGRRSCRDFFDGGPEAGSSIIRLCCS